MQLKGTKTEESLKGFRWRISNRIYTSRIWRTSKALLRSRMCSWRPKARPDTHTATWNISSRVARVILKRLAAGNVEAPESAIRRNARVHRHTRVWQKQLAKKALMK